MTRKEGRMVRKIRKSSIHFQKKQNKWLVRIPYYDKVKQKKYPQKYVGRFKTEKEAQAACDMALLDPDAYFLAKGTLSSTVKRVRGVEFVAELIPVCPYSDIVIDGVSS